jgi:hypothetical protein
MIRLETAISHVYHISKHNPTVDVIEMPVQYVSEQVSICLFVRYFVAFLTGILFFLFLCHNQIQQECVYHFIVLYRGV